MEYDSVITYSISGENGLYVPELKTVIEKLFSDGIMTNQSRRLVPTQVNVNPDISYHTPTGFRYDKTFFGKCKTKNVISNQQMNVFTDKLKLSQLIKHHRLSVCIPHTTDIKRLSHINPGEIYIIKPTGDRTGAGRGNTVVSNDIELEHAKQKLVQESFTDAIASVYITNPLLWTDVCLSTRYKTHFRMFLLVRQQTRNAPFGIELWNRGMIRKSEAGYVLSDFLNQTIHDTHAGTSGIDLFFPEDIPLPTTHDSGLSSEKFAERCLIEMKKCIEPLFPFFEKFSKKEKNEVEIGAFEVYGLDFIITDSEYPTAFLLEINTKVSYRQAENYKSFDSSWNSSGLGKIPDERYKGYFSSLMKMFSHEYFVWIFQKGYIPLLFGLGEPTLPEFLLPFDLKSLVVDTTTNHQIQLVASSSQHNIASYSKTTPVTKTITPKPAPKTFIISGNTGLDKKGLEVLLTNAGYTQIFSPPSCSAPTRFVDFIYIEKLESDLRKYDASVNSCFSTVKSVVASSKKCISNKKILSRELAKVNPAAIARTWDSSYDVPGHMEMNPKTVYILKPVGDIADSGYGIETVVGFDSLKTKEAKMKATIRASGSRLESYIISEYIADVDLFHGKKYHLRMFFLYVCGKTEPIWSLFPKGRIVTAKTQYVRSNFENKDIHDTHSKSTDSNLFFPDDNQTHEHDAMLFSQMNSICSDLFGVMVKNRVGGYPESKYSFEVFGCDFLVRADKKVVLLEVNSRVGMKDLGDGVSSVSFSSFSDEYWNWCIPKVLEYIKR